MTVLEVLENAHYNLVDGNMGMQREIGKQQLSNAIEQLNEDSDADKEYKE